MIFSLGGRGISLFIFNAVILPLTWLTTLLRFWTRIRLVRSFGIDDWLMLMTQIVFTWETCDMMVMAALGFGQHMGTVPLRQVVTGFMLALMAELSYTVCVALLRLSVCFLYFRLTPLTWQRVVLWILIIVNTVYSIGYFFLLLNQCRPISYTWNQFLGAKGTCLPDNIAINASYAHNALSVASDWTLAIMPIFLLRGTKLDFKTKLMVACLLGVGVFASVASIVRLTTLKHLVKTYDFIYTVTPVVLWSAIEPGVAIIGANISTLRPFLRFLKGQRTGFGTTANSSGVRTWSKSRHSGYILNGDGQDKRSVISANDSSGSSDQPDSKSATSFTRPIELNNLRGPYDLPAPYFPHKSNVDLVVNDLRFGNAVRYSSHI